MGLYGFCRLADDAVDNGPGDGELNPLKPLRERLNLIYAGRPAPSAADRAFADVVRQYGIPRELPEALLEGFEWDTQRRRYEDGAQLEAYAARVAGSVGAMMTCLMGTREAPLVARACDLGVAMQLTNIARDVGEDARAGRLYLPLSWLRQAGVDPDAWMREPTFAPALAEVISRVLTRADELYEQASLGIAELPGDCRRGIRAAQLLYAEIGHQLRRSGLDSVSRRTVVPSGRKLVMLARALASPRPRAPALTAVDRKIEWLFALFERLERRDRPSVELVNE